MVDQALELFTGKKAGKRNKQGNFPRGSVNLAVEKKLAEMHEIARKLSQGDNGK